MPTDWIKYTAPAVTMLLAAVRLVEHRIERRRKARTKSAARIAGLAALVDAEAIAFAGSVAAQAAIDDTLTAAHDQYADLYDTPKELTR